MATAPRLVLVDGTALIYRAYYAIPANLTTAAGLHTNAAYGFALMFSKLFKGRKVEFGAVVFDAPGRTFRDDLYPAYKAQRPPMDDELRTQLPLIDALVAANRFPSLRVPGYEADDVIATLTEQGVAAGYEVLIISGDKDFCQLVGPSVRMLDAMRDVTYDEALVRNKWGVNPDQFVDLLALMGDKADNIPGVPGIGQKGAAKLLATFGSLAGIIEASDKLTPRQKKSMTEHRDEALLSQRLATVDRAVPLDLTVGDLGLQAADSQAVDALYGELEFYSLLAEAPTDAPVAPCKILTPPESAAWVCETPTLALSLILDGEPAAFAAAIGLGLVRADGQAAYLSLRDGLPPGVISYLEDPNTMLIGHDLKRVQHGFQSLNIGPQRLLADTMLASFLVEPNKVIPHRIEQVAKEYLHRSVASSKLLLKANKVKSIGAVPEPQLAAFAVAQAEAAAELWPILKDQLLEMNLWHIYQDQERALTPVLAAMERAGILVDAADLKRIGEELTIRLSGLRAEIHAAAGKEFNIASTKQLAQVLFEEMGLPTRKRTKTGYSTASDVLQRLVPKHPIAAVILQWRQVSKLISTYTNVLQAAVRPDTGRIHATFQQTTGVTGRLISTDPDLQRTPIRTPEGKRIRKAFMAPPGMQIISADWSQIELRLLAHVSEDPELIKAFQEDKDVHARTAAALFDVPPDQVDEDQRRVGKTVNFATVYGQGASALGQILGISKAEAQSHIDAYFNRYAGVKTWLQRTVAQAEADGWVTTLAGRRRMIPELSSKSFMDRQAGHRIAANTPIQGSAADLCKQAMLRIAADLAHKSLKTRMLLQVHDELVFETPDAEVAEVCEIVRHHMENAATLKVPLKVDVGVGLTWGEAH